MPGLITKDEWEYLLRNNPFKNQATGLFPTWSALASGTNWYNDRISNLINSKINWLGASGLTLPSSTAGTNSIGRRSGSVSQSGMPDWLKMYRFQHPQYPKVENILNSVYQRLNDLNDEYRNAISGVRELVNSGRNIAGEEEQVIRSILGGNILNNINDLISAFRNEMGSNINTLATNLSNIRTSFADNIRSILSGEEAQRGNELSNLKSSFSGLLDRQRSEIAQREKDTAAALENATNIAIRNAMDNLYASLFRNRLPDSSVTRQAMRIANDARTAAAQALENLKWSNYNTLAGFERNLPQLYYNAAIQNIADLANARRIAESALTDISRGDAQLLSNLAGRTAETGLQTGTSGVLANVNAISNMLGRRYNNLLNQLSLITTPLTLSNQSNLSQLNALSMIGQTLPYFEQWFSDMTSRFTPATFYPRFPAPFYGPTIDWGFPEYNYNNILQSLNRLL